MPKLILLTIFSIFLLLTTIVIAEEQARYSFATMQAGRYIDIPPREEGVGKIYFYNIDGNRITHVSLYITYAPDIWEIKIEPKLHTTQVEVDRAIANVTENFYVEPSNTTEKIPEVVPEGVEYIMIPGRGYAPAKVANIKIKIPENEKIGTTANVTVNAVAEWLGQLGAVAIKQTRDFTFEVKVVPVGFEEKIVPSPFSKSIRHRLNITEGAVRVGVINNTKLLAALEKALATPMDEHTIANLAKLTEAISRDIEVDRQLTSKEGISTLTLKLNYRGDKIAKNFAVYDVIPKSFAESSDEIVVNTKGKIEVVEKDPAYLITYPQLSLNQVIEINYTVNKTVGSEVLDEVESPTLYVKSLEEVKIEPFTYILIGIIVVLAIAMVIILVPKKRKPYRHRKK